MANNGGNDQIDGDEAHIVGAVRRLMLELEQRFDAKINQVTGEMRHTLEQFRREHVVAVELNQRPVERAVPRQQVPLNIPQQNRANRGRGQGRGRGMRQPVFEELPEELFEPEDVDEIEVEHPLPRPQHQYRTEFDYRIKNENKP